MECRGEGRGKVRSDLKNGRARTHLSPLASTFRGRNLGPGAAAANIRDHGPAAVLLCPAREISGIRLEIKKHPYSSAREDIPLFASRPYS